MLKSITPRLTELGKIKIGKKADQERKSRDGNSTWRAPEKLDHFLITTCERDGRGNLVENTDLEKKLLELQGPGATKLTEIPIEVPSDEIDEVLNARWCFYGSKKLWATCDETTCTWFVDNQGNPLREPASRPCSGEHAVKPAKGKSGWKCHAIFNCMIKAGEGSRLGGVYKLRTTSVITTAQLYGSLVDIKARMRVLEGLPLRLVMRPMQVTPDGTTTTVYVVHVELRADDILGMQRRAAELAAFKAQNAKQIEAARAEYRKLLRAPGEDEPPEEQEDVAEEFQPEDAQVVETTAAPTAAAEPAQPEPEPAPAAPAPAETTAPMAAPEPAPAPAPTASEPAPGSPLRLALDAVAAASDGKSMRAAFKMISGLPDAEKKRAVAAYSERQAALTKAARNGAGAAHA